MPFQPRATPMTLRALSGTDTWSVPRPGTGAVLIIDAQEEYRSGALALDDVTLALEAIAKLRAHAREMDLPVLHVRHVGASGQAFDLDARGGAFCAEAEPLAGEPVIDKQLPNAFADTKLAELLARRGIENIIVAGFMTHMCIAATVSAAMDLGLRSAVVANACATRTLPTHDGEIISAADLHRASLAAMSDRFAHILPDASAIRRGEVSRAEDH